MFFVGMSKGRPAIEIFESFIFPQKIFNLRFASGEKGRRESENTYTQDIFKTQEVDK